MNIIYIYILMNIVHHTLHPSKEREGGGREGGGEREGGGGKEGGGEGGREGEGGKGERETQE